MGFVFGWAAAISLIVSIQSSLSYFMSFYGVKPNFVLIFVAFTGMLYGKNYGLVIGFFCGLLMDLLNIGILGFNTFYLFFIGLFSGMIQKKVFEDSYITPFIVIGFFSLFEQFLWNICIFLSGYHITNFSMLISVAFIKSIYNTLITLPIFFLFGRVKKIVG